MPQVIWLPEALEDIQRLHGFLAEKNLQAARNAILCIQAAGRQLENFPEIGRPMRDGNQRREVFVAFGAGAYVLRYRLDAQDRAVVIRVWHTREWRED